MIRKKRSDTKIANVERACGIDLNVNGNALLGNVLKKRGFDSLSQLVRAAKGKAKSHARQRRVFLSFHYEDRAQVSGLRLMARNANIPMDFYDGSLSVAVNSTHSAYVKKVISGKLEKASVLVCLIGNGTAWREWVEWEIRTAIGLGKGVCGVRLKGSKGRAPDILRRINAPIAHWDVSEIISVIECAAARRS